MTQHLARCDKCGIINKEIYKSYDRDYDIPYNWCNTEIGDLCEKCYKAYVAHRDKFLEEGVTK